MRVAVHECFPNHETAEKELVHRFLRALHNLGWQADRVVTSDDVVRFRPDCVIATHYTTPRLTGFPTIGMMTNPPQYFDLFPNSVANVLSYDGYLTGSAEISAYLTDLLFSTGKELLLSDEPFFLSCPRTPPAPPRRDDRRLFYVGMRWDQGTRHGSLFRQLAAAVPLDVYGPKDRWSDLKACYRGKIPFDGVSLIDRIRESGAALCIHSPEHRRWGIPTMRIWEAAAAGAVVITDAEPFGRKHFGDCLLYADMTASGQEIVAQIAAHMDWVRTHPDDAEELARAAHAIVSEKYCLERQFERLPAFVERVRRSAGYVAPPPAPPPPTVEYVVRAGTRPVETVRRALDSVRSQSYPNVGVVLVWLGDSDDLAELVREYRSAFVSFRVVREEPTGVRSNALWAGLRRVAAPYFGVLDDDDVLQPNHVASVMDLLLAPDAPRLARSGGVRVQEDEGHYEDESHFHGPLGDFVPETRRLAYFKLAKDEQLLDGDKHVLSHSWIANRDLLAGRVLEDPGLPVLEDLYLYCLMLDRSPCGYTWRPTAEWHWRSETKDNACLSETCFEECLERVRLRVRYLNGGAWRDAIPAPPPPVRVGVATLARGLWRAATQWRWLSGRVRRGAATLRHKGVRAFLRRLARVGVH